MTRDAELAQLQGENAELRRQLTEARRPARRFVAGTRFEMPSGDELRELQTIVCGVYLRLECHPDHFDNCFLALAKMHRAIRRQARSQIRSQCLARSRGKYPAAVRRLVDRDRRPCRLHVRADRASRHRLLAAHAVSL
jgi:hypothetical protein